MLNLGQEVLLEHFIGVVFFSDKTFFFGTNRFIFTKMNHYQRHVGIYV